MLTSGVLGLPLALLYVLAVAGARHFLGDRKAFLFFGSVLFGLVSGLVWYSWWHRAGSFSFAGFNYYTPPLARPSGIACGVAGVMSGLVSLRSGLRQVWKSLALRMMTNGRRARTECPNPVDTHETARRPNNALQPTPPPPLALRSRVAVQAVARLSFAVRPLDIGLFYYRSKK